MQEVGSLVISRDSISLLCSCSGKLLRRIGTRLMEAMPVKDSSSLFSTDEIAQMAEGLGQDDVAVGNMISALLRIFRSLVYHQPKEEQLRAQMEALGLSSEVADVCIGLWESELGQTTIARLSEITHTGAPRLQNVQWSIVRTTDGSASAVPPPASHSIQLNLQTTSGDHSLRMTRAEAVALYDKLNEMQRRIDAMLE